MIHVLSYFEKLLDGNNSFMISFETMAAEKYIVIRNLPVDTALLGTYMWIAKKLRNLYF